MQFTCYLHHTHPPCHAAFPACVSACEGLPRISLHLKQLLHGFQVLPPTPSLSHRGPNTPLDTERHAASSGGRVNNHVRI